MKEGRVLAGDDFSPEQLETWFAQEKEAYFHRDGGQSESDPWYSYMHLVNERIGFSRVCPVSSAVPSLLALGPGSGSEIERFSQQHPDWALCFVEASDNLKAVLQSRFPGSVIVDAQNSGDLGVPSESQDVVCAFSVLHHVPNVTHVMEELTRVLRPGGWLLVREPCSSMGDWSGPRAATPNERGISRAWMLRTAQECGLEPALRPVPILFEAFNRVSKRLGISSMLPSTAFHWLDRAMSYSLSFNDRYWRTNWFTKLAPSAYFYVFRKPA